MIKSHSSVEVFLTFEGDPYTFWDLLKKMKSTAEADKIRFHCGRVTTLTHEGGE